MNKTTPATLLLLLAVAALSVAGAVDETVETIFVLDTAHHGAAVGVILLAVMVGGLLAGPVSTWVVHSEWLRLHPQLLIASILGIEAAAIIAASVWFPFWFIWLVAGILGFAGTLFWSLFLALLPEFVPESRLLQVNKWISIARNSGFALGPFVGSFLYAEFGISALLTIGLVTVVLAILCLVVTRGVSALPGIDPPASVPRSGLVVGALSFLRSPAQRQLLIAVLFIVALMAVTNVLSVSHITITRSFDDRVFGLYNGMVSIGLVLGPILVVDRLRRFSNRTVVFTVLILWGLLVAAFSLATAVWQLLVIGFAIGLLNGTMVPFYSSQLMSFSKTITEGKALLPTYIFFTNVITAAGYLAAVTLPVEHSHNILLFDGILTAVAVALCWFPSSMKRS